MNIRIPLSSSRAQQCSTSVHKSAEANPSVEPIKKLLHTSMTIVDSPADTSVAGLQDIIEKVLPHTVLQSKRGKLLKLYFTLLYYIYIVKSSYHSIYTQKRYVSSLFACERPAL